MSGISLKTSFGAQDPLDPRIARDGLAQRARYGFK
jgi:hypothetical protein